MTIVLLNNIYFPEGTGGGEMVVRHRAKMYAKEGHTVYILVPGEKASEESLSANITLLRFKPIHLFLYKNAVNHSWIVRLLWHIVDTFNVATYIQVKNIVKRLKPDKVELHNLKGVGFFIPSAIRALRIPVSMYLHDVQLAIPSGILLFGEENKFIHTSPFQKCYEKVIKSLVGSPDEVISPSTWLLSFYKKRSFFPHSKTHVLGISSIDSKKISATLEALRLKVKNKQDVHFIVIGTIEEYKGVKTLLSVWKELPKTYYLHIFGSGSLAHMVKDIAKEDARITYYGYQPHDKMQPVLDSSNALIMPTLCYENRPEVILEAFRNNKPVFASNLGGVTELIDEGKTGALFTPGDEDGLRAILQNDT